jgi:succinoglycan biosynthesis transport protein ExoP
MSRNFELLQRAAKEEMLTSSTVALPQREVARSQANVSAKPANEEIMKLVQRLFFRGGQPCGPKVVSFSGIARDERSSWICARAAESLGSQTDASICVVDANFWSPQLHADFAVSNDDGLAAALTTSGPIRSFTTPLLTDNMWLLSAGSNCGNAYTHVERLRVRFAELRDEFNYVLIAAPPLAREAEATLMGQIADGMVLIVEANHTRREYARQVKDNLETAQVPLLGAVLDQRTFPIPEFLYRRL